MSKAIQYRFPSMYSFLIRIVQAGSLRKIKNVVGKEKSVFEPACGLGRMKNYLDSSIKYSGCDLNKEFVKHGKNNGVDIEIGNMFDKTCYKKSDIVLLCDVVHHLSKNDNKKLFLIFEKFAKQKIIILEPRICTLASRKNIFSRIIAKFFSWADNDGINKIEKWLSSKEYSQLFKELYKISSRVKSYKIRTIGIYYLIEYKMK